MNINSIGSASATSAISPVQPSSVARASSIPPPKAAGASATISKPADLLSRLQQLQAQDPAKLKEVAGQLSKDLTTAAKGATGDAQARLTKLADSLSQVASTGDLSSLQQHKRAGGHRHGHHGGGLQGATSAVSTALSSAVDTVTQALSASAASATSATAAAVTSASTSTATK